MRPPAAPDQPFPWLAQPGRAGRRAGRLRVLRRVAVVAVAIAGVAGVSSARDLVARIEATAGPLQAVSVARHPIPPGATIEPADVEERTLPAGAVPDGAVDQPVGRVAIAEIASGEALIDARLAPAGATGSGATLERDEQAIAIPTDVVMPPVEPGDAVVVHAADDAPRGADAVPGRVLGVDALAIVVALPAAEAGPLAVAASSGRVAVTVRHPADR